MHPVVSFVAKGLDAERDPERAGSMAAYLKTDEAFYGVPTQPRRALLRSALREHPIASEADFRRVVTGFWEAGHREEKHCAIDVAIGERRFVRPSSVPIYERLIVSGAWWDLVDGLAAGAVGTVLLEHPDVMEPIIEAWVDGDNLWLRRTAIISRLKHKEATDAARLFDHCLRRAGETEFFIRKAIGWALREYAKTDPGAVTAFLEAHREELSGLSFREAAKHLGID